MVENQAPQLSAGEAELYDRQIRLWGLESQKRYNYRLSGFVNNDSI